jgi:hypothetical protein
MFRFWCSRGFPVHHVVVLVSHEMIPCCTLHKVTMDIFSLEYFEQTGYNCYDRLYGHLYRYITSKLSCHNLVTCFHNDDPASTCSIPSIMEA